MKKDTDICIYIAYIILGWEGFWFGKERRDGLRKDTRYLIRTGRKDRSYGLRGGVSTCTQGGGGRRSIYSEEKEK